MSELIDAIRALEAAHNSQLDRIKAAVLARPHLDHTDFARAVKVFGWPSDAARGCLLGLVRAAHGSPSAHAYEDGGQWWVAGDSIFMIGEGYRTAPAVTGSTEDESLIAALEAAPTEAP